MKKTLALMMFLLVSFIGTASALPIINGGFENGLTGWTPRTNGSIVPPTGVNAVQLVNPFDPTNLTNNVARFDLNSANTAPAILNLSQNFYLDPIIQTIRVQFDFMYSNAVQTAGDFFRDVIRVDTVGGTTSRFDTVVNNTRFDPISMMGRYSMDVSLAGLNLVNIDPNARIIFSLRSLDTAASFAYLDNVSVSVVPEPGTLLLLGSGLLGLGFLKRRRNFTS